MHHFLLCFLLLLLLPLTAGAESVSCKPLRVGVILPLTGDSASVGQAVRNGMDLALRADRPGLQHEEAQEQTLEIIFEDDGFEPKRTIQAAELLRQKGIAVLVSASSHTSSALAPVAARHNLPLIAIASDRTILQYGNSSVLFWNRPEDEAAEMIKALQARGIRSVARLVTINEWALTLRDALIPLEQAAGIDVTEMEVPLADRSLGPLIDRAIGSSAQAIQLILITPQVGIAARKFRERKSAVPLVGFSSLGDLAAQQNARGALSSAWYINHAVPPESFLTEYQRNFPTGSLYPAAHGYELARVLMKMGNKWCEEGEFLKHLRKALSVPGLFGTLTLEEDRRIKVPIALHRVP